MSVLENSLFELYIVPDTVVMTMQVNGTFARGARVINYDNVTVGAYTSIRVGMTLVVSGAGLNGQDARLRIKSYDSSSITVGENSIIWADNQTLHVAKKFDFWPVNPRILTQSTTTTFYKDYDLDVGMHTRELDPVVNMGPHRACKPGESLVFSSTGSFTLDDATLDIYTWDLEGADNSPGSTPTVTGSYSTEGSYLTHLRIETSEGTDFDAYRYTVVGQPERHWGMSAPEGDRERGGWTAKVTVVNPSTSGIVPGTPIIVNRNGQTWFVGYVVGKSIKWNYFMQTVTFDVVTVDGLVDKMDVFGASTEWRLTSNSWTWWKVYEQTADKAIFLWLRWHTTVLNSVDVYPVGTWQRIKHIDIPRGGVMKSINSFLDVTLKARITSSKLSALYMERDYNTLLQTLVAERPPGSTPISPSDLRGDPEIIDESYAQVSYKEIGGFHFKGTGVGVAYLCEVPGTAPDPYGSASPLEGLALPTYTGSVQSYLNEWAGDIYADEVNRYRQVQLPLSRGRDDVDIAPQRWWSLTASLMDTEWASKRLLITGVRHQLYPGDRYFLTDLTVKAETVGIPGITKPIITEITPEPDPPVVPIDPPVIPPTPPGPTAKEVWGVWMAGSQCILAWTNEIDLTSSDNVSVWNIFAGVPANSTTDQGWLASDEQGNSMLYLNATQDKLYAIDNLADMRATPNTTAPSFTLLVTDGDTFQGLTNVNLMSVASFRDGPIFNLDGYVGGVGDRKQRVYRYNNGTFTNITDLTTAVAGSIAYQRYAYFGASSEEYIRNQAGTAIINKQGPFGAPYLNQPWVNDTGGPTFTVLHIDGSSPYNRKWLCGSNGVLYDLGITDAPSIIRGCRRGTAVALIARGRIFGSSEGTTFTLGSVWDTTGTSRGAVEYTSQTNANSLIWATGDAGAFQEVLRKSLTGYAGEFITITGNWWTEMVAKGISTVGGVRMSTSLISVFRS